MVLSDIVIIGLRGRKEGESWTTDRNGVCAVANKKPSEMDEYLVHISQNG